MENKIVKIAGKRGTDRNHVWVNGSELKPFYSAKLLGIPENGMDWGAGGIGDEQTAFAIILRVHPNVGLAKKLYKGFTEEFVRHWPETTDFETTVDFTNFETNFPDIMDEYYRNEYEHDQWCLDLLGDWEPTAEDYEIEFVED